MSPSDAVSVVGGILALLGFLFTWLSLRDIWRDRWPNAQLSPRWWPPLRERLTRAWFWVSRPFRAPRHYAAEVRDGLGIVSFHGEGRVAYGFDATAPVPDRLARLEEVAGILQGRIDDETRALRDSMERAVAEVTNEQRAQWAVNDSDAREQARIALGLPALLIFLGAVAQVIAPLLPDTLC